VGRRRNEEHAGHFQQRAALTAFEREGPCRDLLLCPPSGRSCVGKQATLTGVS